MRLDELRNDLDEMARAQPDPDHDGGRRSVSGRVRRHRRRTRLTSLAALIVIVAVGAVALRAGSTDAPRVDVGVTSGVGPFPHLVPGYVPGGLTPTYETFDWLGREIESAEGLLPPMSGPGYAIAWGDVDASGRVGPTSPRATFLNVLSAPVDLEEIRAEHPGSTSVDVSGDPGLLAPLPDSPGGWFVIWLPSDGGTALVSRPCSEECPPDEALRVARSVRPVDQIEWQRFLSRETTAESTTSAPP